MLRRDIRVFAKEIIYTVVVSVVLFSLFAAVRTWRSNPSIDETIDQARREMSTRPVMYPGKRLTVSGVDISRHPYALLLITSPACSFCTNSAPFHRRLKGAAQNNRIPLWVVVPSYNSARPYLDTLGLTKVSVLRWQDLSRSFQGVPSVVLVNSHGVICRIWLGELRKEKEEDLLSALRDPSHYAQPVRKLTNGERMLTRTELRALPNQPTLISLDTRQQFRIDHPAEAINIPLDELAIRAERDLRKKKLNVIDCSGISDEICSLAVDHLRRIGFSAAAVDFGQFQ